MGFWVEEIERHRPEGSDSSQENIRLDLMLLALGKRAGLSFAEINELTSQDLLDFVNIFTGSKEEVRRETRRMATQEDIDRFFTGL